jgi:predicted RNA methylase
MRKATRKKNSAPPARTVAVPAEAPAAAGFRTETWPLTRLTANPKNYRRHPESQLAVLRESLRVHGLQKPVVAQPDGTILAGHGLVLAAQAEGWAEIPVRVYDGPNPEAFLVMDNRSAMLAEDDLPALLALLETLAEGEALPAAGYDGASLAELIAELNAENPQEETFDPEAAKAEAAKATGPTRVQLGEVWRLGRHRVMCGDSTNRDAVLRLLGEHRPSVVVTDPPYGLDVEGVTNDGAAELVPLLDSWSACMASVLADNVILAVFQGTRTFPACLAACHAAGFDFLRYLGMYKRNDRGYPWRGWLLRSEAILLFSRGEPRWPEVASGAFSHDTYEAVRAGRVPARAPLDIESQNFPIKPLEVVEDLVAKTTLPGSVLLDCFLGSGTTLIAAEKLGRICYGMEICAKYCDVALARWEQFTGKTAERVVQ